MTAPPEHRTDQAPSAQTLASVADALAWPLLVLQPDAGLLHANLAARELLRRGQPLVLLPRRRVAPADRQHRAAFNQALQTASSGGTAPMLWWPSPAGRYSATVRSLVMAQDAQPALLLALSRVNAGHGDLRGYAELHGLTGAETRVLERLARGADSAGAAAALGILPATVRSHAVALRRKTGHASVPELLHTLATLPPLGPPGGAGGEGE